MYRRSPFVMMNRIFRTVLYPDVLLRSKHRPLSVSIGQSLKVKVIEDGNGNMKISFRYGAANNSMNVSKTERLEDFLSRLKKMITIHRQRDQLFSKDYESVLNGDGTPEDVEVCLIHNDQHIESSIPCVDAWTLASFLKIDQLLYEVDQDNPTVHKLSLPNTILAGCVIRPHFIIEHANAHESSFVWYHSVSEKEAEMLKKSDKSKDLLLVNEQWWVKIHEGFLYWTSQSDLGRKLRVMCTPRSDKQGGETVAAESPDVVLSGPERFPFEERHLHTKQLTSSDSIRCLSYNILANVYVERKKFPYCSRTARDVYYRKQLLFKELLGYNSDILCLQEVQERNFEYDLEPILQKVGFDGFYMKKGGRRSEGVACFFRTSKFKLISNEAVLLNDVITKKDIFKDFLAKVSGSRKDLSKLISQESALQILLLEHADNPKRRILVANTHLYSNKDMPEVRLLQSATCVVYLEHLLKLQDDDSCTALLFCGDFNSLPGSSVLQFLLQGSIECYPNQKNNTLGSTDATLRHNLSLDSACGFPEYTNYTEQFSGCLDYIFYNKNIFSVSEIVPFPSHESVTQDVGLPSELFPSDHIPIICTLKWK